MDKMISLLRRACDNGEIRQLDLQTGLFLERISSTSPDPALLLAATMASAAVGNGHVCLPLAEAGNTPLRITPQQIPPPATWSETLLASPVVGRPGATTPLVLDGENRLYLYRFFQYEQDIANDFNTRANMCLPLDNSRARLLLDRLYPGSKDDDLQRDAAALALLRGLLVIAGGPGTGKTHTVARILALVQALADHPLRIGLAAPTGKAAARLEEAITRACQDIPPDLSQGIPHQARTLHRLLGYRPGADDFVHNKENPLPLDLLVIDEASMIDVVMMAALVRALPPTTRLLLLGDRYQLASVEAGSLFGDLSGSGQPCWSACLQENLARITGCSRQRTLEVTSPMADNVVTLQKSYRFDTLQGIGSLAAAVNSGSMAQVKLVREQSFPDLQIEEATGEQRMALLSDSIAQGFGPVLAAQTVEEALAAMESFRILCAVTRGPSGVEAVNELARRVMASAMGEAVSDGLYAGKPIIIRHNQYDIQLFNGDTGILWPDKAGRLRAWFRQASNQLRAIAPARLPAHDLAYAITIHKSQGSEFERVLLLLPEEESRVLSRELLYTGITRARSRLILCADQKILSLAVARHTRRHSGLAEKIWGGQTV